MRSIVTGGAGFIGSHLSVALKELGHDTYAIDNLKGGDARVHVIESAGVDLIRMDIRDQAVDGVIADLKPDLIFHLAAQMDVRVSVADPVYDADVNVIGTLRLLEAARKVGSRFISTSSGGCIYGDQVDLPVPETVLGHPDSPYGVSKKVLGDYLHYYEQVHGLRYVNLALANVYGPRQDPSGEAGVVAIFGSRLLKGDRCVIYGDGKQTRDYVFVGDVVDGYIRSIGAGDGELMNVGTGIETSVRDLYDLMSEIVGVSTEPRYEEPRPGELMRSALDASKAKDLLGWEPLVSLREGLGRTVDWLRGELG